MKFAEYNLHPKLLENISSQGYQECTPIQTQTIPIILSGKDIAGLSQTGTGKTAAFLIPLIERLLRAKYPDSISADLPEEQKQLLTARAFKLWRPFSFVLVLVPTRELADQVLDNLNRLTQNTDLKGCVIYGGTGYDKQMEALKSGVDFVIATPGRLIDLYKEHQVDLKLCRAVIFDEADRMFDMGFKDDMKYILSRIPRDRQFLVFSATLNFDVLNVAYEYGADPVEINISKDQTKAENVTDKIFHIGNEEKPQHLLSILKLHQPKQAIIFTNFKFNVERITKFLNDNQVPAMAISSLLTQAQRNRVMQQFRANENQSILVATDVAARGLDIKGVDLVINYELPGDCESYVHRIGRTGRAGNTGLAFSLVSDKDVEALMRIEDFLKHKLEIHFLEDKDLLKDFVRFPQEVYRDREFRDRGERDFNGKGGRSPHRKSSDRGGDHRGPRPKGPGSDRPPSSGGSGHGKSFHKDKPHRHDRPHPHKKSASATHPKNGAASHAKTHSSRKDQYGKRRPLPPHSKTQGAKMPSAKLPQKTFTDKVRGLFRKLFG